MRRELSALQRHLGTTMIFVTHDQEEAMSLGDEIFLFNGGHIVQQGEPLDVYHRPASRYAAEFFGKTNFIAVDPALCAAAARAADQERDLAC